MLSAFISCGVLGAFLFAFWGGPGTDQRTTIVPPPTRGSRGGVAQEADAPLRPSWLRREGVPTDGEVRASTRLASRPTVSQMETRELTVDERDFIMEMRDRVARRAPPSHAWAWNEVLDRLGAIGTEIPLRVPLAQVQLGCSFMFVLDTGTLLVCTENLRQALQAAPELQVDFEATLAHEMTHAAHLRRIQTYSGFTGPELKAFHEHCWNINAQMLLTAETLGNFNGAAYFAAYGNLDAEIARGVSTFILDIYRLFNGSPGAERNFMHAMLNYVGMVQAGQPSQSPEWCSPMVMLRGAHMGRYFFSSDVTPEIVPLLELVPSLQASP